MATKVLAVGLDSALVARVLSAGSRRVECEQAGGLARALESARRNGPELVVLGGDASLAAVTAEALLEEPASENATVVAWGLKGASGATAARLVALGVHLAQPGEDVLRGTCEEILDAREGRTIRVDPPADAEDPFATSADLHGRRVLVADDDPGVVWFIADVLRKAGCDVEEVVDGEAALDRARRTVPDLVFCDIRMPRLDGFRLSRALRADPILGDVPVVLLSWKEDWLQQAQEQGAAAAYLPKRSAPEEVLATTREVLAVHARFERRLRERGPVRGRLDGTAPYRLLRLACATRPSARMTLRCHPHAYEVQIREGAPRAIRRVAADGGVLRGSEAMASLLTEATGRFTLAADTTAVETELEGSLHQQIAAHVARSRGLVATPAVQPPGPPAAPASEPAVLTLPIPLRRTAATQTVERTLPLPTPARPAIQPRMSAGPQVRQAKEAAPTRSVRLPLGWMGVVAVALVGIVLGAGVRAAQRPAPESPRGAAR